VKSTGGLALIELHEGVDLETVRARTGCDFDLALGSE
jgi:acyl CoA:acetate/3-ketoacid CoA transferase beta subunit